MIPELQDDPRDSWTEILGDSEDVEDKKEHSEQPCGNADEYDEAVWRPQTFPYWSNYRPAYESEEEFQNIKQTRYGR